MEPKKTTPSKLTLRIKANSMREPFGGHHYEVGGQTFKGKNYDEVVRSLAAFRINNNIPLGNPDSEVIAYYAVNWPWLVEEYEAEPKPMPMEGYLAWRLWLMEAWNNPPKKLLTNKEASERFAICRKCPMNMPISRDGSPADEMAALKRKSFLLRRGSMAPEGIGYCTLHRVDLSVFCFLDNCLAFSSKKPDAKDLPECWASSLAAKK